MARPKKKKAVGRPRKMAEKPKTKNKTGKTYNRRPNPEMLEEVEPFEIIEHPIGKNNEIKQNLLKRLEITIDQVGVGKAFLFPAKFASFIGKTLKEMYPDRVYSIGSKKIKPDTIQILYKANNSKKGVR